ncbi:MAG: anaerobic ribonucleoside-triphosphate reductase [Kiritimatiellae bacterium]|nr:anaerobic ribonucleoside-triphosphate reductase [Kiritimatiellia bacterium]
MSDSVSQAQCRPENRLFQGFRKRSGVVVPFRIEKIENAIQHAVEAVARKTNHSIGRELAPNIARQTVEQLNLPGSEYYVYPDEKGLRIPCIEDVQDLAEIVLSENGQTLVVAAYKRYRKQRQVSRERIRVRDANAQPNGDVTDASLLLVESTGDLTLPWNRQRIVEHILTNTELSNETASAVAKAVENHIIDSDIQTVNSTLVRELVNNELMSRGLGTQLRDLSVYGVPKDFVQQLMYTKSQENSNIVSNNAEAVNLGIAELVLKQWALDTIFSADLKYAHDTGAIHLHDLGYPHRVYCSSHSIEYVKKYGLCGLVNLNSESHPAKTASVLTGHLNTFLASMQSNYAGALGIAYINILYAPLLENMEWDDYKQVAQELIFNGAQNAFSRGGQSLFLDFNIHTGVPRYLKDVPAIGPGGKYMLRLKDGSKVPLVEIQREELGKSGYPLMDLFWTDEQGRRWLVLREELDAQGATVYDSRVIEDLRSRGQSIVTYGDYAKETQTFCRALLDVFSDGDRTGRVFEFPKCDFHISDETFQDPEQYAIFLEACNLASKNGSTYFIFDRDEVTLSACCRLRTTIEDDHMLRHPESMRFCGFQNVTINIPQAAYRASRKDPAAIMENFYRELDETMALAAEAHLQKKRASAEMISGPGHPLWQIGRDSCDGKPYVDLEKCTYIIGLIGLNDAIKFLIGKELHESRDAMRLGLRVISHMFLQTRKLCKKHGLKFTLEESPAESAARRLAKTDLVYFENEAKAVVKGPDAETCYYTNSIHLTAEADVSLVRRIREQAKFHSLIESGAITHAFVGEEQPSAESVAKLMTDVFHRTQSAQVTVSPEFTYCNDCEHTMRGLKEDCDSCGSQDIVGETRVVGYFSKIQNWNKSKRYGELLARHRGQYSIECADSDLGENGMDVATADVSQGQD